MERDILEMRKEIIVKETDQDLQLIDFCSLHVVFRPTVFLLDLPLQSLR